MIRSSAFTAVFLLFAAPAFCSIQVGDTPPPMNLQSLIPDQPPANATLEALKGKAVVIEFWAT